MVKTSILFLFSFWYSLAIGDVSNLLHLTSSENLENMHCIKNSIIKETVKNDIREKSCYLGDKKNGSSLFLKKINGKDVIIKKAIRIHGNNQDMIYLTYSKKGQLIKLSDLDSNFINVEYDENGNIIKIKITKTKNNEDGISTRQNGINQTHIIKPNDQLIKLQDNMAEPK